MLDTTSACIECTHLLHRPVATSLLLATKQHETCHDVGRHDVQIAEEFGEQPRNFVERVLQA